MTAEAYFAYVVEYQQALASALILAKHGLADPSPDDLEELEVLYTEDEEALRPLISDAWKEQPMQHHSSNFDPIGYTHDGAAYHSEHFPIDLDPDAEDVWAIFNWDEDGCLLTCDVCGTPLAECDCFDTQKGA